MAAQQHQSASRAFIYDGAGGTELRPGLSQEDSWQGRLRGLEQCLCELLMENQRLRMSLMSAGVDPLADITQI
jgi:hypothetical protein